MGHGLAAAYLRALFTRPRPPHTVRYLDLSDMSDHDLAIENAFIDPHSLLNAPAAAPLHVLELSSRPHRRLAASSSALRRAGWVVTEVMARSWIVRSSGGTVAAADDPGYRRWKMGAESWGMYKVPVAEAEVGGMYGMFMFGRKF